jgi:DNA-3-methyladenine glycosylase II
MGELIRRTGDLDYASSRETRFQSLARSILDQQISVQAAATIHHRLRARVGGRIDASGLDTLDDLSYRECGVSRQKRDALRDLAARSLDGRLRLTGLHHRADEEVIEHLTQVRGVGRWTAEMFLIFVLGRPDVLSVGDLGLQNAARRLYELDERPTPLEFEALAEPWRPWRSLASWYLWSSLGGPNLD